MRPQAAAMKALLDAPGLHIMPGCGDAMGARKMQPRVEPHCSIAVDPARTMADPGVEAGVDCWLSGAGECCDACVQIRKEAGTVMRPDDQAVVAAVQC